MQTSGRQLDMERIRRDFPILAKEQVFLDSVASSLTPTCVVNAMGDYYENFRSNVHRGSYDMSMKASEFFERATSRVARFIGADDSEIVFTMNTTAAINLVALSLQFNPGDEVIVSSVEHTSNLLPWIRLTNMVGIKVRCYDPGPEGRFDEAAFTKLLNDRTRMVAMTYVSNSIGSVFPVHRVAELCRQRGVMYLVDAAQAAPHMPLRAHQIGCDFLAFSGHKMLGPTGVGVLYIRRELADKMVPAMLGGGTLAPGRCGCPSVEACGLDYLTFQSLPHKWQAGTPPIAEVLGLSRAMDYLEEIGFDAISSHVSALTERAVLGLREIPNVELIGSPDPADRAAIVSFNIRGVTPSDVGAALNDRYGVAVRTGDHCALAYFRELPASAKSWGSVRASFYLYNTDDDVNRLLRGVADIAAQRAA